MHCISFCYTLIVLLNYLVIFMILAGTPETIAFSGTSLITTEFGAITALSPTVRVPYSFAPIHISTLFPIDGTSVAERFVPMIQLGPMIQLSPSLALLATRIPPHYMCDIQTFTTSIWRYFNTVFPTLSAPIPISQNPDEFMSHPGVIEMILQLPEILQIPHYVNRFAKYKLIEPPDGIAASVSCDIFF